MSRFRLSITLLLAATLFIPLAHAGPSDACFNFLDAQDYPRALEESASLLKLKKLGRENEFAARLCRGRALYNTGQFKPALPELQRVESLSRSQMELAVAYNWPGSVYAGIGDLANAELYHSRALQTARCQFIQRRCLPGGGGRMIVKSVAGSP